MSTELANLFIKHECDKAQKHQYHLIYGPHFEARKNEHINILEVGVFKAASTKALLEYFPFASFYGIDIFDRVTMESTGISDNNRVNFIKADSTNENLTNEIKEAWGSIEFDIIIDDGLHVPDAMLATFKNCFPLLNKTGTYFIEDVWPTHKMSDEEIRKYPWLHYPNGSRRPKFGVEKTQALYNYINNYQLKEHDNSMKTGNRDSFIFEIKQ